MCSIKLFLAVAATIAQVAAGAPQALVYRGPAACGGCPEALGHLLRTAPSKFNVTYVGPNEDVKLDRQALSHADLYAQPGGGGISRTWPHMKPHYDEIRDFVSEGGVYLGSCLGAYFAGEPGFQFLPKGYNTNEECTQPGAQVTNRSNTIIQVDWHFATGKLEGQVEKNRWIFFQDGAVVALPRNIPNATILATYSSNNDLAALITPFGKGRVAIQGPHTEATKSWYSPYTPYKLHNPDGIHFKYGWDLVEAALHGPKFGGAAVSSSSPVAAPSARNTAGPKSSAAAASTKQLIGAIKSWYCLILLWSLALML